MRRFLLADQKEPNEPFSLTTIELVSTVKEIAKRLGTTGEELRGKDRRWVVAKKRAEAVTLLVRHYHNYRVTEVARYLGREQANVNLMLSRYAERMARGNH